MTQVAPAVTKVADNVVPSESYIKQLKDLDVEMKKVISTDVVCVLSILFISKYVKHMCMSLTSDSANFNNRVVLTPFTEISSCKEKLLIRENKINSN